MPVTWRGIVVSEQHDGDLGRLRAGPILYARGQGPDGNRVAALLVRPEAEAAPDLRLDGQEPIRPRRIASLFGAALWRYEFSVPADATATYAVDGQRFEIQPVDAPAMRIAYVSCNGQEEGDLERDVSERDIMWSRLAREHESHPFALLLQGGDQLYADDVLHCHPEVEAWAALPMERRGEIGLTDAMADAIRRFYFFRYLVTFCRPAFAALSARVPSVMMWDDHDIVDGWGSHPASMLDSAVGRALFTGAREMFLLFQLATVDGDLPDFAFDAGGRTLGFALRYRDLSLIVPDLRSERRPERVMDAPGWDGFERAVAETPPGDRVLVLSSVPALGPRLSLVEATLDVVPHRSGFEDDLRDQWQSRVHRDEWRRFLEALAGRATGSDGGVTVLSGEIHLATRGEMRLAGGTTVHQLVASGISHPAPNGAYPVLLGLLARLGESPVEGSKIRILPLPGSRSTYCAERNYLVLSRAEGAWSAVWERETSLRTPKLPL